MNDDTVESGATSQRVPQDTRVTTLERLLGLEATSVTTALEQAAQLVQDALGADKVDIFLYEPGQHTLVAVGVSHTPLGERERALGLDRLAAAHGDRTAQVFQTGVPYLTGQADQDPLVLPGFVHGLGIRSMLVVPWEVNGERRGVLGVDAGQPAAFRTEDLHFLEAVARWIGLVVHRVELSERLQAEARAQAQRSTAEQLITVLAHDLNNYLTPLKGYLDLIDERARRDERARDVHSVARATHVLERVRQIIGSLLDAERLTQGLFALSVQPVNQVSDQPSAVSRQLLVALKADR